MKAKQERGYELNKVIAAAQKSLTDKLLHGNLNDKQTIRNIESLQKILQGLEKIQADRTPDLQSMEDAIVELEALDRQDMNPTLMSTLHQLIEESEK
ncbi:MAG: hypothetical protein BZ138_07410 [Methanosphaera sp. rholeuAM270]|nr:MAG: hypothetical protein BZ138_07410 [Methanosphaera sp. rholeuAM270]